MENQSFKKQSLMNKETESRKTQRS